MSTDYPLSVEQYTGNQAMTIICDDCAAEAVITADDLLNEGIYACPRGCRGMAFHKYAEADKCAGCGELGWYDPAISHCCSRKCMLQAEYAKTLTPPLDAGEAA